MRRRRSDAVDFPANPFIVLADFVITLLLIMILGIIHQSISSSSFLQRTAIDALQKHLMTELSGVDPHNASDPVLKQAFQTNLIQRTISDGDLQRFWLNGKFCFDWRSSQITPGGQKLLAAFASVLSRYQGDRQRRGNGLFKYIIVEGHADPGEGSPVEVKNLSVQRAQAAVQILKNGEQGLSPVLIKECGRGDLDRGNFYFNPVEMTKLSAADITLLNKRIEIVVVYSGKRALDYYKRNFDKSQDESHAG